jgi:diacylglycerol kinase
MLDLKKFARSLTFAWKGIATLTRQEQSFRLQLLAASVLVALMLIFELSRSEIAVLLVVATSVLVLELLNGAVERLVDLFKPRIHQYAEEIKDMMAGAVLVGSAGALAVGVLVFWPHVLAALR